jgi:membrane protein
VPADTDPAYGALLDRLPPPLRRTADRLASRWPGRVAMRSTGKFVQIELFDRSMAVAAQLFTSVIPVLIVFGAGLAGTSPGSADALGVPEEARLVMDEALQASAESATYGVLGVLVVLAAATSLSRALSRAFAAVWDLPRPTFRLTSAWRWVAVVLVLALALVATRTLSRLLRNVPPAAVDEALVLLCLDVAVALFLPWFLLSGRVRPRMLLPGALLFGLVMLLLRPASSAVLPAAVQASAERYGSIGVAFTYLAWLYALSFCLLTTSVLGQVVATDPGALGRWVSGRPTTPSDAGGAGAQPDSG